MPILPQIATYFAGTIKPSQRLTLEREWEPFPLCSAPVGVLPVSLQGLHWSLASLPAIVHGQICQGSPLRRREFKSEKEGDCMKMREIRRQFHDIAIWQLRCRFLVQFLVFFVVSSSSIQA